jgi:hypothetical protein
MAVRNDRPLGRLGAVTTGEEELLGLGEPVEVVDALPVRAFAQTRAIVARPALGTVAQAAAVAVTGFAAGAVAAAVVHRSRAKRPALGQGRRNPTDKGLTVQSTRSFLVDVHTLAPRD